MNPITDLLRKCEAFVADELECRQKSYLPTTEGGDLTYVGEAAALLAEIKGAIHVMEAHEENEAKGGDAN